MSEPPATPDPAHAMPAEPVGAPPPIPVAAAVRVQANPYGGAFDVPMYTEPAGQRRPGVITAMGVGSIVVASLQIIFAGFCGLMCLGFYVGVTNSPVAQAGNIATAANGPRGYDSADRRVIVQAMSLRQKMTSAQRDQVQFFLSEVGADYVPSVPIGSNDSVADYGKNIADAGASPEGGVYFDLPMGKLEVTDTAASIRLADGKTVTRSTVRKMPNPSDPSRLSPEEVAQLVNRVNELNYTGTLTPSQTTELTQAIQNNSAAVVGAPKDVPTMLGQIQAVSSNGGVVYVHTMQSIIVVPPSGAATVSATTLGPTGLTATANTAKMLGWLIVESALSGALALYLLTIGIFTLRNSPRGGLLHKMYLWPKILLSVGAAMALGSLIIGGGADAPWAWLGGLSVLIVGSLYPIVLLFVLSARSVRAWYATEVVR